jgi:hypothetical protein
MQGIDANGMRTFAGMNVCFYASTSECKGVDRTVSGFRGRAIRHATISAHGMHLSHWHSQVGMLGMMPVLVLVLWGWDDAPC